MITVQLCCVFQSPIVVLLDFQRLHSSNLQLSFRAVVKPPLAFPESTDYSIIQMSSLANILCFNQTHVRFIQIRTPDFYTPVGRLFASCVINILISVFSAQARLCRVLPFLSIRSNVETLSYPQLHRFHLTTLPLQQSLGGRCFGAYPCIFISKNYSICKKTLIIPLVIILGIKKVQTLDIRDLNTPFYYFTILYECFSRITV